MICVFWYGMHFPSFISFTNYRFMKIIMLYDRMDWAMRVETGVQRTHNNQIVDLYLSVGRMFFPPSEILWHFKPGQRCLSASLCWWYYLLMSGVGWDNPFILGGWRKRNCWNDWQKQTRVHGTKPAPVTLCLPQITLINLSYGTVTVP